MGDVLHAEESVKSSCFPKDIDISVSLAVLDIGSSIGLRSRIYNGIYL
jgi:hypothetical protein